MRSRTVRKLGDECITVGSLVSSWKAEAEAQMENSSGSRDNNGVATVTLNLKFLACPLCSAPLRPPIFQCPAGHVACDACHKKLNDQCPSCHIRLGYTRNRALEHIADSATVPCLNASYGCNQTIPYSRPSSHCWNCSYSPHFCPLPHCDHKAPTSDIVRHLGDHHHVPVNFYNCKDTVQVCFSNMDPLLALQLDDSILCLLRNNDMPSGRAISIVCRQPLRRWTILRKTFLYKIVAKHENGTQLLLDNAVMKFCEEDSSDVFLYLPEKFYCNHAELQLEVCIWKV